MTVKIIIRDEVNIKIEGLEPMMRRKLVGKFKYQVPYARHLPAVRLGRWDGCIQFFATSGTTYLKLLEEILPEIEHLDIEIEDHRQGWELEFEPVTEQSLAHVTWPENHPSAGTPVTLRDYQVEAINAFLAEPQSIQEISTGAGKTIMTATLCSRAEKYGRTLTIVPNVDLVKQTLKDYQLIGLDVGVFYGSQKEYQKTHTICTWQSLNSLGKKTKDGTAPVEWPEFVQGVNCIIVDEAHMAKGDVLKAMLSGPFAQVPIRWGLTGTIPKEEFEWRCLHVGLGAVVNKIRAADLQDQGVLAQCKVNIVQIQDQRTFSNYQSELKFLLEEPDRLKTMSKLIAQVNATGNTLVLVDRVAAGHVLAELLGEAAVFVSGATKAKARQDEYDEISISSGKIIIATYGIAAVGINIPRIFNLVLIEPGKSFVRVIQSIGRGIRKAEDKDHVEIWDVTSTCKFAKRHLTKRKQFYKEANYPFSAEKLEWMKIA
jgi:superfamily II DNA or RNA helicase